MKRVVINVQDNGDMFTHRWLPGTLQGRAVPDVPEQHLVLRMDRGRDAQYAQCASAVEHWLLLTVLSVFTLSALPAKKDKAEDGGEGKNQVCGSTKYKNL